MIVLAWLRSESALLKMHTTVYAMLVVKEPSVKLEESSGSHAEET
jgi:hypothetical protein